MPLDFQRAIGQPLSGFPHFLQSFVKNKGNVEKTVQDEEYSRAEGQYIALLNQSTNKAMDPNEDYESSVGDFRAGYKGLLHNFTQPDAQRKFRNFILQQAPGDEIGLTQKVKGTKTQINAKNYADTVASVLSGGEFKSYNRSLRLLETARDASVRLGVADPDKANQAFEQNVQLLNQNVIANEQLVGGTEFSIAVVESGGKILDMLKMTPPEKLAYLSGQREHLEKSFEGTYSEGSIEKLGIMSTQHVNEITASPGSLFVVEAQKAQEVRDEKDQFERDVPVLKIAGWSDKKIEQRRQKFDEQVIAAQANTMSFNRGSRFLAGTRGWTFTEQNEKDANYAAGFAVEQTQLALKQLMGAPHGPEEDAKFVQSTINTMGSQMRNVQHLPKPWEQWLEGMWGSGEKTMQQKAAYIYGALHKSSPKLLAPVDGGADMLAIARWTDVPGFTTEMGIDLLEKRTKNGTALLESLATLKKAEGSEKLSQFDKLFSTQFTDVYGDSAMGFDHPESPALKQHFERAFDLAYEMNSGRDAVAAAQQAALGMNQVWKWRAEVNAWEYLPPSVEIGETGERAMQAEMLDKHGITRDKYTAEHILDETFPPGHPKRHRWSIIENPTMHIDESVPLEQRGAMTQELMWHPLLEADGKPKEWYYDGSYVDQKGEVHETEEETEQARAQQTRFDENVADQAEEAKQLRLLKEARRITGKLGYGAVLEKYPDFEKWFGMEGVGGSAAEIDTEIENLEARQSMREENAVRSYGPGTTPEPLPERLHRTTIQQAPPYPGPRRVDNTRGAHKARRDANARLIEEQERR